MAKKKGQKFNQIIDAAVSVIAENGYHNSQVSKIAKKAGVADGTIYLYFKNKEDILVSLFEEKMGVFVQKSKERLAEQETIEDKLYTLIEMHLCQLEADHDLAIVTQLELRQSNIALRNEINEVLKAYYGLIDHIIDEGVEQGVFPHSLNKRVARQMTFGAIDEVVTNWVMKDMRYDLVELAHPLKEMIFHGLKQSKTG
ncbi:TetR/AcrR family transcriptional regulator [Texcoconibacillus texcoconensis]|uniref:TetR/AcrR family fatty acid metabolism transcriptional regulator n=1 Tax=Texcoconibacillus texcoconensis TaxID=1095777 RepID=A0A840QMR2_9BACI|nr:TetR/AcrR family transcriptional regulator [Texcoconibacillus texcoconensis]MBB5172682.1 TetR/AcrR family fatty acid metabolism transcriptional regulator [Texcoconibacillus texcoconensis]